MRKTIMRVAVLALVAAGGLAVAATPAQAGGWITHSLYGSLAACQSAGAGYVAGIYDSYQCNLGTWPCSAAAATDAATGVPEAVLYDRCGDRGYILRLYIS
ncbi:hypothetical protein [Micromonospora sp. CA-111912]|uniref:hypothetical protein n=1 Tax=Micromonospora sp. CA-111912 TaxID=3239955 RepID=UPI003D89C9FF